MSALASKGVATGMVGPEGVGWTGWRPARPLPRQPPVVVPIGFDLGAMWTPAAIARASYGEVRVGAKRLYQLPHPAYMMWRTAFYVADQHAAQTFTREHLAALARRTFGSEQPFQEIDRLLASGLLAELHPDQPWSFLHRYRMFPSADGQGNRPDDLSGFVIGRTEQPDLIVDWHVYTIWSTAAGYPNIADALTHHARERRMTREQIGQVTSALVAAIPVLVSTHYIYLQDTLSRMP